MSSEKIDKTKKNIKVTHLNEKEKKDLFNKFVEAGGKVVKEDKRKGLRDFDRSKQKMYSAKLKEHTQKMRESASPVSRSGKPPVQKLKPIPLARRTEKGFLSHLQAFFDRWRIRFRLYFMAVADLSGLYFSKAFLEKMDTEVKSSLQDLQLVHFDIFKQNVKTGQAILEELDKLNPLYYELMDMSAGIFDRTMINEILEHHLNFPRVAQRTSEIKEPLMMLFKKLYVLYPYQELIMNSFETAIGFEMRLEKGKSSLYSIKRKKIRNSLYVVFQRLFSKLYWLICFYHGAIMPLRGGEFEKILGITDADMPGRRRLVQPSAEEKAAEQGEQAAEEEKTEELPPEIRKGLELIYGLDPGELRARYDKNGVFKNAKDNDKILLAFLYYREFDSEYSFILTTNKIKYSVQFTQEGKIDYRVGLTELYNELRGCASVFRDYADSLDSFEKIKGERPSSSEQFFEYSNRLTAADKKRSTIGKNVRMTVRAFMDKASQRLKQIVDDMNEAQKIVENPQDVLSFDSSIEGSKKMQGKKVYEAILSAYYFSSAFMYRLSPIGDLHGELEFNEEDMKSIKEKMTQKKEADPSAVKDEIKKKDEKAGVIDELEDLF